MHAKACLQVARVLSPTQLPIPSSPRERGGRLSSLGRGGFQHQGPGPGEEEGAVSRHLCRLGRGGGARPPGDWAVLISASPVRNQNHLEAVTCRQKQGQDGTPLAGSRACVTRTRPVVAAAGAGTGQHLAFLHFPAQGSLSPFFPPGTSCSELRHEVAAFDRWYCLNPLAAQDLGCHQGVYTAGYLVPWHLLFSSALVSFYPWLPSPSPMGTPPGPQKLLLYVLHQVETHLSGNPHGTLWGLLSDPVFLCCPVRTPAAP